MSLNGSSLQKHFVISADITISEFLTALLHQYWLQKSVGDLRAAGTIPELSQNVKESACSTLIATTEEPLEQGLFTLTAINGAA